MAPIVDHRCAQVGQICRWWSCQGQHRRRPRTTAKRMKEGNCATTVAEALFAARSPVKYPVAVISLAA
eukprot:15476336-Alexandrium_andersonii.AAC.1